MRTLEDASEPGGRGMTVKAWSLRYGRTRRRAAERMGPSGRPTEGVIVFPGAESGPSGSTENSHQ